MLRGRIIKQHFDDVDEDHESSDGSKAAQDVKQRDTRYPLQEHAEQQTERERCKIAHIGDQRDQQNRAEQLNSWVHARQQRPVIDILPEGDIS